MDRTKLHFETLQLHVGQEQADPATDARAVPIYQTTSYVFHNADDAAARFGLQAPGNIYGRLTNSTQGVFEERVAALEGGIAGLAVASGAAAISYAFENITRAGDHIVAAKTIYGGSYNLLAHTLPNYGVTTTWPTPCRHTASPLHSSTLKTSTISNKPYRKTPKPYSSKHWETPIATS